eukprot:scaffold57400_cov19-Prasinocladus_malaysianus.AAC.2
MRITTNISRPHTAIIPHHISITLLVRVWASQTTAAAVRIRVPVRGRRYYRRNALVSIRIRTRILLASKNEYSYRTVPYPGSV